VFEWYFIFDKFIKLRFVYGSTPVCVSLYIDRIYIESMKKSEEPTLAQAGYIRDTAIELGITRAMFQTLRDDGTWTNILKERRDQILAERENCITFELSAIVNQGCSYIEALENTTPQTPSDYKVRKVGELYPPTSDKEEKVDFVLRKFPKNGGSWDKALEWAKSKGYKTTNPREVFAVVKQHNLRILLKRSYLYLVATDECYFEDSRQTVYVCVDTSSRKAILHSLDYFGDNDDWFLFRK
jgi:hypothetical protein